MQKIEEDKMYSPIETAKFFGVTIQTLRNWDKKGTFKAIRTGGRHRRYLGEEIIKRLKTDA